MSQVRRRERGSAQEYPQLNTTVPKEHKDFFTAVARRAGVSANEFMEQVLKHLRTEIQEDGLPYWYDRNLLPEELPIARAS